MILLGFVENPQSKRQYGSGRALNLQELLKYLSTDNVVCLFRLWPGETHQGNTPHTLIVFDLQKSIPFSPPACQEIRIGLDIVEWKTRETLSSLTGYCWSFMRTSSNTGVQKRETRPLRWLYFCCLNDDSSVDTKLWRPGISLCRHVSDTWG